MVYVTDTREAKFEVFRRTLKEIVDAHIVVAHVVGKKRIDVIWDIPPPDYNHGCFPLFLTNYGKTVVHRYGWLGRKERTTRELETDDIITINFVYHDEKWTVDNFHVTKKRYLKLATDMAKDVEEWEIGRSVWVYRTWVDDDTKNSL